MFFCNLFLFVDCFGRGTVFYQPSEYTMKEDNRHDQLSVQIASKIPNTREENHLWFLAMSTNDKPAHAHGCNVAHVDGRVRFLSNLAVHEKRRSMIHVQAP